MDSQLIDSLELWECPQCQLRTMIAIFPVYCDCGYIDENKNGVKQIKPYEKDRIKICKSCDNYSTYRCKRIDLGCCKTFLKTIENKKASCPMGKWDKIDENGV